jgi:hypothetical protein
MKKKNKMNKNKLKEMIREIVDRVLNESDNEPRLGKNTDYKIVKLKNGKFRIMSGNNKNTYGPFFPSIEDAKKWIEGRDDYKSTNNFNENAPAPSKPKPTEKPGPAVAPGKPGEKKEPNRRKIGNPNVKPERKMEGLNEEEMLNKIVARFKSKK